MDVPKRRRRSKKTARRQETQGPSWEEATKTAESEWRLEPEGKIIIVSDMVEEIFVDLDDESRHE